MYKNNIYCKYDKSVCHYLFWKWFDIINGPFSNIYFPLMLFPFEFCNGLIFHFEIFDAVFLFGRFKTFCRRILLDLLFVNSTINSFSKVSYYTHWPRFKHSRKNSKQCMYRDMSQWYRPIMNIIIYLGIRKLSKRKAFFYSDHFHPMCTEILSLHSINVNVFYAKQSSDISLQFYPDIFWPRLIAQNGQADIFYVQ